MQMDPFITKWLLSLVVGVIWVTVSTTVAEKISGKLGGLIVGMPSTAVISLLFIGLTQGVPAANIAATVMVFSAGLYCLYFFTYLLLTPRGFYYGLTLSLFLFGFYLQL